MQITVLRKTQYSNSTIYVLQFEYVFMYLFTYKGEIFMDNIIAKPSLWQRILWRTGRTKTPYSEETTEQCMEAVLNGAVVSIDALIKKAKYPNGKAYSTAKGKKPVPTNK